MADYFLRHGEYPAYSAIPSGSGWPLPAQDGDGLGTSLAVSASGTISLAGVTAVAGNTLAIMGAVLTCVASGPAANQFAAGTGATLAIEVARAINAATATVNAGTSAATPQLRDMLYARVDPGTSTDVQIMTRPGSATLNHAGNSAVAITSAGFGVAPAITQFAGGASGAWGYLWNSTGAIWPIGKAIHMYGVVYAASASRPLVGPALTIDDWVIQRGSGTTLHVTPTTSYVATTINVTAWLNLLIDNGAVWPGQDSGFTIQANLQYSDDQLTINIENVGVSAINRAIEWCGARRGNFKCILNGNTSAANAFSIIAAPTTNTRGVLLRNILFDEGATVGNGSRFVLGIPSNGAIKAVSCDWIYRRNVFFPVYNYSVYLSTARVEMVDCTFTWTNLAVTPGALIQLPNGIGNHVVKLTNCKAIGASPSVISVGGANTNWASIHILARNMAGFSLPTTLLGSLGQYAGFLEDSGSCLLQNIGSGKAFRLETCMFVADWMPGQNYPTLNAVQENGTPWSVRLLLSNIENAARYGGMTELWTMTKKYEVADAAATVALELYVPSALVSQITDGHLGVSISYTDSTGVARSELASFPVRARASTTPLATSSASWTANGFGGYVARKIQATTQYAVKQNTDMEVALCQRRPMPAQVELFLDPDVGLS